jgi:hypothetical protein
MLPRNLVSQRFSWQDWLILGQQGICLELLKRHSGKRKEKKWLKNVVLEKDFFLKIEFA